MQIIGLIALFLVFAALIATIILNDKLFISDDDFINKKNFEKF